MARMAGEEDGISLTGQEAEKMSNSLPSTYLAFWGFKILTSL